MSLYYEVEKKLKKTEGNSSGSQAKNASVPAKVGSPIFSGASSTVQLPRRSKQDSYIDSFVSEANKYLDATSQRNIESGRVSYSSANNYRRDNLEGLRKKGSAIREYLKTNAYRYDKDSLLNLYGVIDYIDKEEAQYRGFYTPEGREKRISESNARLEELRKEREGLSGFENPLYRLAMSSIGGYEYAAQSFLKDRDRRSAIDQEISEIEEDLGIFNSMIDEERIRTLDQDAAAKEIEALEEERKRLEAVDFDWTDASQRAEHETRLEELDSQINQKQADLRRAGYVQHGEELASVADRNSENYDPEFLKKSSYTQSKGDAQYEWINNRNGFRYQYAHNLRQSSDFANFGSDLPAGMQRDVKSKYEEKGYDKLTESEINIYNYYYAKEGPQKAQEYLDSIQETLNRRKAEGTFGVVKDNVALEYLFGVSAGLDQFGSGMEGALNALVGKEEYLPVSEVQMASQMIRQDLGDKGWNLGGNSVGQIGYDIITNTANMAPSMMVSVGLNMLAPGVGTTVGSAMMGLSSGGSAYQDAINRGYSKNQARGYGLLVGASEAILGELISGIPGIGGRFTDDVLAKFLANVDSAFIQAAAKIGGNALSEFSEEYLQEILTPVFENLALGTDQDIQLLTPEAIYSGILGALTAGILESPGTIYNEASTYKTGKKLKAADAGTRLAQIGRTYSADSVAYQLAGKVNENTGAYTIGRLFNEINATLTEENEASITRYLTGKRMSEDVARDNARVMAAVIDGGTMSDLFVDIVESNDILADAMREVIINPNSTVLQRSKNYKDILRELANEMVGAKNTETNTNAGEEETTAQGSAEAPKAPGFKSISSVKNGVKVRLEDDSEVSLKDADISPDDSVRIETIARVNGMTPESADFIFKTLKTNTGFSAREDALGAKEAFEYGYHGFSMDHLKKHALFNNSLTDAQRKAIYEEGQRARNQEIEKTTPRKGTGSKSTGIYFDNGGGNVVAFNEGKPDKMKEWRSAGVQAARVLKALGIGGDIYFFESYLKDGKRVYKDKSGNEVKAPNGWYDRKDGSIHIDLNAGEGGRGTVLFTLSHELTHFIEEWSPKKYKVLADFLIKEYEKGQSMDALVRKKQKDLSDARGKAVGYEEAFSEVVADSMEAMLADGNVMDKIVRLKAQDRDIVARMKAFFDNLITKIRNAYKGIDPDSTEGYEVIKMTTDTIEQLQQLLAEALVESSENFRSSLVPGEESVVVNQNGDPVAYSNDDGSVMLSISTYEEEGRKAFRDYLQKCVSSNRLTKKEMHEMMDGIEDIYKICKEFKDKYAPFSAWSDAAVVRDTYGRPVFSVVTPNGDYKMNLDFSLVCKKRRTLDAVFNEMARRGIIDDFELGQKSIVKINEIIRKYGLETACALCFVDAKRFRQASMADSFTNLYNELVLSLVPESQRNSIDHFNFAGYETIKKVEGGIDTWDVSRLDFSHLDDVMREYGKGTVEHKAAKYIKSHPEGRKLLLRGDFMSSQGFDAVKTQNRDILKLYNSKKGTGGPKAAFGDVQYMNEIIKKAKTWTPAKAYAVGGVRIQSFSDYVPRMVFDYTQMIYDLAATKLPAHAYTKEALFVKQFGLTGIKINMSLIPAIAKDGIAPGLDANGNYVWAGESFDYETAKEIQKAEGYTENCGTICVGVSHDHILKLLRDPNIRMVIPYHKSGLNPIVAHMNKIAEFTDYTNEQRTKGKDGKALKKDFDFSKALHDMGDKASPKAVADQYLKWCVVNGYTARFAEFAAEENYYKLLEDFTLYDKDGNYVPQREVRAVFPNSDSAFGSMKELIREGLQEDAIIEGRRDLSLSAIVDEIQNTLPRAESEIAETEVNQADRDIEAVADINNTQVYDDRILSGRKKSVDNSGRQEENIVRGEKYDNRGIRKGNQTSSTGTGNDRRTDSNGTRYAPETQEWGSLDSGVKRRIRSVIKEHLNNSRNINEILAVIYSYIGKTEESITVYADKKARELLAEKLYKDAVTKHPVLFESDWSFMGGNVSALQKNIQSAINNGSVMEQKNGDRQYSDRTDESVSSRTLLANALEGTLQTDWERRKLQEYKDNISKIEEQEAKLQQLNAQIRELSFAKGPRDKAKLTELRIEATKTTNRINIYDKILLRLEAAKPLQDILARERKKVQEKGKADTKKAVADYKKSAELKQQETLREYRALRAETKGIRDDYRIMEKEFIRIAKEYEKLNEKSRKETGKNAQTISDLRKSLAAETKKHKNESAKWAHEFTMLLKEYDAADRKISTLEEKIRTQRASAKSKVDSRKKTELRNKITDVIRDIDGLFNRGDKKRNVKEGLRDFVSEALSSAQVLFSQNFTDENMLRNGIGTDMTTEESAMVAEVKKLQDELDSLSGYDRYQKEEAIKKKMAPKLSKLKDLFARERARLNKATVSDALGKLAESYRKLQTSEYDYVQGAYHEAVYEYLKMLDDDIGGTYIKDMTRDQLEEVYKAYTMVKTTISNANRMFADNLKQKLETLASLAIGEIRKINGKDKRTDAGRNLNTFSWNNEKPVYAFERLGSDTFKKLFGNIRKGQDVWAIDLNEADEFRRGIYKKYNKKSWDTEKTYSFQSSGGARFELTLDQIMSLYAYSKRDQAYDHLMRGGIVFDNDTETVTKKLGIPITYKNESAVSYNLSPEILDDIVSKLTPQQKAFVDDMQQYLSDTMGDKGNEISLQLYGIKLFNEENYFPLRSAGQYMERAKEADMKKQQGFSTIVGAGFAKSVKPNASNPVVLSNFMDVWADHVNEMSMYHAFVLPLEDFRRVYNFSSPNVEGEDSVSVYSVIQNTHGKAAVDYLDQLYRDLNGGALTDNTAGMMNKFMSLFKKGAVFASASVVIQQPSAIARAFALIDYKYFIGPKVGDTQRKLIWPEVKKYAPVAFIKDMGYFDTGMGRSARDYLQTEEYVGVKEMAKGALTDADYRDEILSKGPALADQLTWCSIWQAVKRETKAKHPNMDVKSEAFLKLCGERFSEVIDKTQVYDSVLSRSANMRSKDTGMKMVTAFLSEPTTSINMIEDAVRKGRQGDKKYATRAIGAVVASMIFNSALVSLVEAGRDDDDDQTYWEKYLKSFAANLADGINPATYIPFVKDVVSIFQGYDVNRSDMSIFADIYNAFQQLSKDNVSGWKKVEDFAGSILKLAGIPLKNIMRDLRTAKQMYDTFTNGEKNTWSGTGYAAMEGFFGVTTSQQQQLLEAYIDDDTDHAARIEARYQDEKKLKSAVKSAIRERYLDGDIDKSEAREYLISFTGEEIDDTYWTIKEWDRQNEVGNSEDKFVKYEPFYEAVMSGENLDAVIKEFTDNGVEMETLSSQLSDHFRVKYINAASDEERKQIADAVIEAKVHMGAYRDNAEKLIGEWDFAVEHGGESYDDMVKAYKRSEISREEMIAYMMEVGKTEDDIESTIIDYDIVREYGINYKEREVAYREGRIDANDLREIYAMKNYEPDEIEALIEAHDWLKARPEYNGVYASDVKKYLAPIKELGYNLEDAGITLEQYQYYVEKANDCTGVDSNGDGKADSGSEKKQKLDLINSMNLTREQKDTFYYFNKWSKKSIKKTPWY